jgi:transcriptional regulator with XRE-family HTH domain
MPVKQLIGGVTGKLASIHAGGHHRGMVKFKEKPSGPISRWPQDEIEALTTFGKRVESARLALGLSQSELARRAKCSPGMINSIERGARNKRTGKVKPVTDCKSALVFRISDALEVSARWLVWESGPVGKWEPLTPEEREIITYYRELPPALKESARAVLSGLRGTSGPPSRGYPYPPKK